MLMAPSVSVKLKRTLQKTYPKMRGAPEELSVEGYFADILA
jgi:hypothetical protein